ncbi:MAG: preprotein translocase subunit SecG [Lachnospiraceae bacterium]|nr:preprotein translocase subunit SecG [Lachnospiraceae bacterium]MDD7025423.1 preprotein translocase subunit SecG [Oscillospiraceae bacterium]MDY5541405.1 preprotein translocase subunit SecG [Lachnospiraceae bacterium]MDY5648662.1 preprotein translocase subunit SecG [Lachnospiraceae bacterium]
MEVLRVILTIVFVLDCIALSVVVLLQEGKNAGLGALSGASDTYWSKNKGRSREGIMIKVTVVLGALFIILGLILNLKVF